MVKSRNRTLTKHSRLAYTSNGIIGVQFTFIVVKKSYRKITGQLKNCEKNVTLRVIKWHVFWRNLYVIQSIFACVSKK